MSIDAMNAVWRSTLEGTPHRFVLLALADRADDEGYCWPGIANIMDKTDLSRSSVKRSIRHLEASNLLQRAPRFTIDGDRDSNMYQINVELLLKMARPRTQPGMSEHSRYFPSSQGGGATQDPPRDG
jgi:hypothetical protein